MFKNLTVFDYTLENVLDLDKLESNIYNCMFVTKENFVESIGFTVVKDGWDTMTHTQDGNLFLRVKHQKRKVGKAKLNDAVTKRLNELRVLGEDVDDYSKGQLELITQEVFNSLLPTADYTDTYIFITICDYNTLTHRVLINNTSASILASVEDLLCAVMKDYFSHSKQVTVPDVVDKMTAYVASGKLPEPMEFGDKVVLLNTDTKEKATVDKQDPLSEEVLGHINSGKMVQELRLVSDGVVSFNLTKDSMIKNIKFDLDIEGTDEDDTFTTGLLYWVKELNNTIDVLIK